MTSSTGGPMRMLQPSMVAEHMESIRRAAGAAAVDDIAFDPEGIDKIINWINAIIDEKLRFAKREVVDASRYVHPPGDYAGNYFVENGQQFARDYEAWADDYADKLQRFVRKLENLKKAYEAGEQEMVWGLEQGMRD